MSSHNDRGVLEEKNKNGIRIPKPKNFLYTMSTDKVNISLEARVENHTTKQIAIYKIESEIFNGVISF